MSEEEAPTFVDFMTHVLHGGRSAGNAVPVEVLADLVIYKQIVVAVARELYFRKNHLRQRVPRGFEDSFQLVLRKAIAPGSAVATLERCVERAESPAAQPSLFPADAAADEDYFANARDLTAAAIAAVIAGKELPTDFPRDVLPLFNAFGRSLQDDETLELRGPRSVSGPRYTRAIRRKMVLLHDSTYEDRIEQVAEVAQFDVQRMTFELISEGRRIPGKLQDAPPDAGQAIRTAAAFGAPVRVTGIGRFDANDDLMSIPRVETAVLAEDERVRAQLDVEKRLAVLAQLPDGWLDGAGAGLNRDGLMWLAAALKGAEEDGLPRPYLYPMPDGRVQAEWEWTVIDSTSVSAEIDLVDHTAKLLGVHHRTGAATQQDLVLDPAGLARMIEFVKKFVPASMGRGE